MVDKIEKKTHEKTLGLNNPKTDVLTHNGFKNYLILIFIDIIKSQKYKMPYRDSPRN